MSIAMGSMLGGVEEVKQVDGVPEDLRITLVETAESYDEHIRSVSPQNIQLLAVDTETVGNLSREIFETQNKICFDKIEQKINHLQAIYDTCYKKKTRIVGEGEQTSGQPNFHWSRFEGEFDLDTYEHPYQQFGFKPNVTSVYNVVTVSKPNVKTDKGMRVIQEDHRGEKLTKKVRNYLEALKSRYHAREDQHRKLLKKARDHKGGLHFWENQLGCIQLGFRDESGVVQAFLIRPEVVDVEHFQKFLNEVEMLTLHNAQFDYKQLLHHKGVKLDCGKVWDTQIAERCLTNGLSVGKVSFLAVAERRLGITVSKNEETRIANWAGEWTEDMVHYAALDVYYPLYFVEQQVAEAQVEGLTDWIKFECSVVPVSAHVEMTGMGIDLPLLKELAKETRHSLNDVFPQIRETMKFDEELSNKEVQDVLNSPAKLKKHFREIGLDLPSTDAKKVLKHADYPEVQALIDYREPTKLLSTYLEPFQHHTVPVDGHHRIYGEFHSFDTKTFRYSSRNPNLQNFPKDEKLRSIFVPRPGYVLVDADLSSIEPRIAAEITGDPLWIKAFNEGLDIYKLIGTYDGRVRYEDVTKEQRTKNKPLALSKLYGKSIYGLMADWQCEREEAQYWINLFDRKHYAIVRWTRETEEFVRKHKYVETITGMRRYLPNIDSDDRWLVQEAIRQALNTQIQGPAGTFLKEAMMMIEKIIKQNFPLWRIYLTLHDQLVLEVPDTEEDKRLAKMILKECMIAGVRKYVKRVPILVGSEDNGYEPSIISNLGEAV